MNALCEIRAGLAEQAIRMRKMWSAVVLHQIIEMTREERKRKSGIDTMRRWADSADGREVLRLAGIEPSDRVTKMLVQIVADQSETKPKKRKS